MHRNAVIVAAAAAYFSTFGRRSFVVHRKFQFLCEKTNVPRDHAKAKERESERQQMRRTQNHSVKRCRKINLYLPSE